MRSQKDFNLMPPGMGIFSIPILATWPYTDHSGKPVQNMPVKTMVMSDGSLQEAEEKEITDSDSEPSCSCFGKF